MKRALLRLNLLTGLAVLIVSAVVLVQGQALTGASAPPYHAASAGSQTAGNEVIIDNFTFTPATLTIPAGTQVTWTNHDDIPHNIVNTDNKFKSKALDTNESFSYSFTEPGTYEYFCGLHPRMTAKIIVEAKN